MLIATTGLALRHIPMSAKLSELIGPRPRAVRMALAWVLSDETFGLSVAAAERGEPNLVAYKAVVDAQLLAGWILGTIAGVVVGDRVDPSAWGAEVFFALLFIGLAAPLIRNRTDGLIVLLAIGAAFLAAEVLPSAWQITVAAVVAAGIGTLIPDD